MAGLQVLDMDKICGSSYQRVEVSMVFLLRAGPFFELFPGTRVLCFVLFFFFFSGRPFLEKINLGKMFPAIVRLLAFCSDPTTP